MRFLTHYLQDRRTSPLYTPTTTDLSMADTKLQSLKALDPHHPPLTPPPPQTPVDVINHNQAD